MRAKIFCKPAEGGPEKIDDRRSRIDAPPLPVKNDTSLSLCSKNLAYSQEQENIFEHKLLERLGPLFHEPCFQLCNIINKIQSQIENIITSY